MKNEFIKTEGESIKPRGKVIIRAYKAGTKELVQEIVQENLIMVGNNIGKDLLVQWLLTAYYNTNFAQLGITPIPPGVNYGAIGTGSTTPAITDTQLTTETNRTIVAYAADLTNNEAQLQFYFPDSILATGTIFKEFGIFIGGSASANSGHLFNHALFGTPYTKVAGTDTTVEVDISFT